MPITCTVGPDATTGKRCGKPAVVTFTGSNGEEFAECAEHCMAHVGRTRGTVVVRRNGIDYVGRVVRETRGGRIFAEITYKNGVTRVVEA